MATTKEGRDAAPENPQVNPIVPDTDESEILGLHSAIEKVLQKIKWHEEQIEERRQDIRGHEDQIEELRVSLRKHVGPLMAGAISHSRPAPNGKRKTPAADGAATGELIAECLRTAGKPTDTKHVKEYLEKQGNHTNPSVELSRMVKRGQIERAGRGLYQLKK
jgi:hypothetical protein